MAWHSFITDIFFRPKKIRAIFIDETGSLIEQFHKYSNNKFETKFGEHEMAYIIDHNRIVYDKKKMPTSFYHVGDPSPIDVNHKRDTELDAIGFKKILDSKTIVDLFSNDGNKNLMTLLIILIIGNIILSVVIMMIQFHFIKVPGATS